MNSLRRPLATNSHKAIARLQHQQALTSSSSSTPLTQRRWSGSPSCFGLRRSLATCHRPLFTLPSNTNSVPRNYCWSNNSQTSLVSGIYHQRWLSSSGKNGDNLDESQKEVTAIDTDKSAQASLESSDDGDQNNTNEDDANNKTVFFPWRHSTVLPARVIEQNDFSGMPNNIRARFVRKLIATRELGLSFWEVLPIPFYTHEWEVDLADNFSVAFGLAMEELLHVMLKAPVKNVDGVISVDTSADILEEDSELNEGADIFSSADVEENEDSDETLRNMIDKALLQKYKSMDLENMQVKLSIQPVEATLQHIFAVPMLTRDIVEQKPHLKGGYQRIEKCFQETKSYQAVKDMTYKMADDIGPSHKRTVIAEAVVRCLEFFQVVDTRDGTVVQGMPDGKEVQEVFHVVRFEVQTDKSETGQGREVGNWKIIDLDDMLDGNVFH